MFQFISKTRPIVWGLLYLICIPLFACIYHFFLTYDFYQSALERESDYLNNPQRLLKTSIKDKISNNFIHNYHVSDTSIRRFKFNINDIIISDISTKADVLSFQLLIVGNQQNRPDYNIGIPLEIISESVIYAENKIIRNVGNFNYDDGIDSTKIDIAHLLFNANYIFEFSSCILTLVFLSDAKIENQIRDYTQATKGFSSNIYNNYLRMFYLSAITITTVGFGDIVPITTRARIVIAIEAILGIVLIGLFLNSIGNSIKIANI